MKSLKNLLLLIVFLLTSQTITKAQIIFTRDTVLTGTHIFNQGVGVYDSTVTVTIEFANITFNQGMTVEWGTLVVWHNSELTFTNGYGLSMSRNARLEARHQSSFYGAGAPIGISFWKCRVYITDCEFVNTRIGVMETWGDTISVNPTFRILNSSILLDEADTNPMIFSQGVNMQISTCFFERDGTNYIGQYPNIHLQSNKHSRIENCYLDQGGISAGSILNSDIEIINNIIDQAEKGISFWGVNTIEYNRIENVNVGIEGGTLSNKISNVSITNNNILNVSGQAIDLVGEDLWISKNTITGNGITGKGIRLTYSSGSFTNNLISDFKITESSGDIDGIALYIRNATPIIEVSGNTIEHCGLSNSASPEIICSIVYLESNVNFISNDIRLNTLGGLDSPTNSFAGGPVLNIISPGTGTPIIKYNLIHSNNFVATGVYEPTNTAGTLVAIDFDTKIEFKGNYLIGEPALSLGVVLFPEGAIDSLLFEENTIMNNFVGIGTMQSPVLGTHNIIKENTYYHIMRYGYGTSPTLYALSNNWDSDDPVVIDNMLFDDEEGYNTGPIDFGYYYSTSYDVNITNSAPPLLDPGDSLEITAVMTDLQGNPSANKYVFFSSSNPNVARFYQSAQLTGGDGSSTSLIHAFAGGTTQIVVFAGDTISETLEINVEGASFIDEDNESNRLKGFILEQNYPNPFNPITTIKYKIAEVSNVEIIIYDILGRRVLTLVNEIKNTGSYEIKFDASSLTCGIYFYRLTAGSFAETRKMVLLK